MRLSYLLLLFGFLGLNAQAYNPNNQFGADMNAHGVVYFEGRHKIFLGRKCDAYSPSFGRGYWYWANGGTVVEFQNKRFAYARSDPPNFSKNKRLNDIVLERCNVANNVFIRHL